MDANGFIDQMKDKAKEAATNLAGAENAQKVDGLIDQAAEAAKGAAANATTAITDAVNSKLGNNTEGQQ